MSRSFSSTSDHLDAAVAVINTRPCTISMWIKQGNTGGTAQHFFNIGVAASSDNRISLFGNNSLVAAAERDTVTTGQATATGTITGGVWYNLTGVFTNDSSRAAFRDGANKGTNASATTPASFTATRVSGNLASTLPILGGGLVAYIGVWNVALLDAEVLTLASTTPDNVRPGNLIEYWPLTGNQSPEPSFGSQGTSLTVTGTTFSTDNPLGSTIVLMGQALT